MLNIITDKNEIARCQKEFAENLIRKLPLHEKRDVGFQGATIKDLDVHKSRKNRSIWFGIRKMHKPTSPEYGNAFSPRYWNAFGFETKTKESLNITVEINFSIEGTNNRLGGLFAKDTLTGKYFVLHRGKIGGGRKGVGKKAFKDFYSGRWVEVKQDNDIREAILIASIGNPFDAVCQFVENVREFKERIKTGEIKKVPLINKSLIGFSPEFAGIKSGKRNAEFEYETFHGIIVHELRNYLTKIEAGKEEFNDQFIDLGFRQKKKIVSLYEVKTSCNRQSIYIGIGQLMVHSSGDTIIKKTLVLPEPKNLRRELYNTLQKLNIRLLYYERKGQHVRFYPAR